VVGMSLEQLIKRPEVDDECIWDLVNEANLSLEIDYDNKAEVLEQALIHYKYEGYISKSLEQARKMRSFDERLIPDNINYDLVDNIALDAREKIKKIKPKTIGQASRISGVNPADISVLVVYVEKLIRSK
jgi:tRNA uridine 5-carboxymethylaminomethyl modification enzyme